MVASKAFRRGSAIGAASGDTRTGNLYVGRRQRKQATKTRWRYYPHHAELRGGPRHGESAGIHAHQQLLVIDGHHYALEPDQDRRADSAHYRYERDP